ncbi:MAG: shikimate dehydrogenase [Dermatophilaceae bacterium]
MLSPPPKDAAPRAGVRGRPIAHSLSPVLHTAAYRALGLTDWTYDRVEVDEGAFLEHVAALDPSYRGLSLTMPLKEVAFQVVHTVSDLARRVGAINTIVRDERGWRGYNTDVYGIIESLHQIGVGDVDEALLVGAGATARSALEALAEMHTRTVSFMVRGGVRAQTVDFARSLGMRTEGVPMGAWPRGATVIVGTVPGGAYAGLLDTLPAAPAGAVVLDCVYGEPTALLEAAHERGYATAQGTDMLLHQARGQVKLMTGHEAPVDAMRAALDDALAAPEVG